MRQQWEYKVAQSLFPGAGAAARMASFNEDPSIVMNLLAKDGWEFVQAVAFTRADGVVVVNHYLRRETEA
jgi:hypothetical protein